MKGYTGLGASVGDLVGAFLNRDAYREKGYNDTIGKVQQARYYDAKTQEAILDAAQKRRSLDVTPETIAQSLFGIDPDTFARIQAGDTDQYSDVGPQIPIDPMTVDQGRRASGVHTAFTMGGGNVDQIMSALLKGQQMNAQDNVMTGAYEAPDVARAVAASKGEALYDDGTSGILDIFTGGVTPTARSKAATGADNALAEQRRQDTKTGGRDPARIALQKFLVSKGLPEDQSLELSMMDLTPKEIHQKVFLTALASTMGSNDTSRKIADDYLAFLIGPNWQRVFSGEGGMPTPADNDPLGIR